MTELAFARLTSVEQTYSILIQNRSYQDINLTVYLFRLYEYIQVGLKYMIKFFTYKKILMIFLNINNCRELLD